MADHAVPGLKPEVRGWLCHLWRKAMTPDDCWRAFNDPDREKFTAPTVTGADYPRLGFSVARNDPASGVLALETYAASSSARGEATRFCVRNLPDPNRVRVRRDGREHSPWRTTGPDSIEIETTVGPHRYEIFTGYRGRGAIGAGERRTASADTTPGNGLRVRSGPAEISSTIASVRAGAAACPCCAAGMS